MSLLNPMVLVFLVHLLFFPASCTHHKGPSALPKGLFKEDKIRLGSTPPSCHNRCNECHPCMAVQVPTLPRHSPVQGTLAPSTQDMKYSNYKALGWKCSCGNHFFNP